MKSFKIPFALLVCAYSISCSDTSYKISDYIRESCYNGYQTCKIDLREALKVDYDRLYLFNEYTTENEIKSVLSIEYKSHKTIADSEFRIILLKNNQIVYEDNFNTRFIRFVEVTEKADTIHKNTKYLMHSTPYYTVTKLNSNSTDYHLLTAISDQKQYRYSDYSWPNGYKFEEAKKK